MDENAFAHAQTIDDGADHPTAAIGAVITVRSSVLPRVQLIDGAPTFSSPDSPRFVIQDRLGEGGVGEVLRAHDEDIGRSVAIKRLRGKGGRASTTSVARFLEEMRVTGGLDHPNVVPVHDVGVDPDGDYFFVMRHVQGETLETIIARLAADDPETHRRFGVERRVEIFKSVLDALAYAHSRGIVHRDIKPANIMVGPFGEVVVMDWGIAKPIQRVEDLAELGDAGPVDDAEGLERAFVTQAGALVGTPAYMAPEQVVGQPVDERTDIYAAAVMFHELLYLRHYLADKRNLVEVCNAVKHQNVAHELSTQSQLQPGVPADLYWFVEMGMRKEPERRFQTVAEMLDRLERRSAGEIHVQCRLTATRRGVHQLLKLLDYHPQRFFAGLALLLATVVVLAVAFLWLLLR